ncbi:MAG: fructosamine kinase family protein [Coraliomargarita sp.]
MDLEVQLAISDAICAATGEPFRVKTIAQSLGGCIHTSAVLSDEWRSFFVKVNTRSSKQLFSSEATALRYLKASQAMRVPEVIAQGDCPQASFLVLEALEFATRPQNDSWQDFGRQLAELHQASTDRYGWIEPNFIGATPQQNEWNDRWAEFFRDQRLIPQFDLAKRNGYTLDDAGRVLDCASQLLDQHRPEASLLHGDLWSGNAAFLTDGSPVLYDPASYFGDRETDLAFSRYFGGFPADFYASYQEAWPLPDGFIQREPLYNLYHVLNHLNLFGGSYVKQAMQLIGELLN